MTRTLPIQYLQHRGVVEGAALFPGLLHFPHDTYIITPSVKQSGIKYNFFSFWYVSTWDWSSVSMAIGEHLSLKANGQLKNSKY